MFQDPILNDGIRHCYGFFAANSWILQPLSEVVLYDDNVIIAILGPFERPIETLSLKVP